MLKSNGCMGEEQSGIKVSSSFQLLNVVKCHFFLAPKVVVASPWSFVQTEEENRRAKCEGTEVT